MASPIPTQASGAATQPLTPPADPPTNTASQANAAISSSQSLGQPTPVPATSLQDTGKSRRPRDARLIHMLLASQGVTAYQERVPLQLLDFAYRYTSSVLQDAVHLATEGYAGAVMMPGESGPSATGPRAGAEIQTVTLPALRLSIASRLHYQFQPGLPKEFLMDVAAERNRIALPGAQRGYDTNAAVNRQNAYSSVMMGGMRLPPERFCLSGTGWNLKDAWESEGEEEVEENIPAQNAEANAAAQDEEDGEGEDEGDGKMEDIFGEDTAMGEDGEEDKTMTDV